MPNPTTDTATVTIRLPAITLHAINAAKPWLKAGCYSRNQWLAKLMTDALDMRTVPREFRGKNVKRRMKSARGRIR